MRFFYPGSSFKLLSSHTSANMVVGNLYAITAVSVIGGGLFGFDISSMSAIITTPAYKCYFNHGPEGPPFNDSLQCSGLSSLEQGGVTAAMPAGSWLGALISGFISDRLGRKYAIMSGCIIWYITVLSNFCLYFDPHRHFTEQQLTIRLCLGLLAPSSSVLPRTWVC